MARSIATQEKIDNSDPANYPDKRIRNNDGSDNGTPVNEQVYGDFHQLFLKLMRDQNITYNGLPDNVNNGYQLLTALTSTANKNDIFYQLSVNGDIISLPLKLATLKENEILKCQVGFNFTTQNQIKGSDNVLKVISVAGNFKTNDHVYVINTAANVLIIRDINFFNLLVAAKEVGLLTKASLFQEYAGTSEEVASTPYTNQLAFARRVIGLDSGIFLSSPTRNGLMSKEDKAKFDKTAGKVMNIGTIAGVNIGDPFATQYVTTGDLNNAQVTQSDANSFTISCNLAHNIGDTNFYVKCYFQSSGSYTNDRKICGYVFKPITTGLFELSLSRLSAGAMNLKIIVEVVKL